jgi:hypothetical protein
MSSYSIVSILCVGLGVGGIIGFCIKYMFCSDEPINPESDTESDSTSIDLPDYINYLEQVLNDSTIVTTESVPLQQLETDSQNITAAMVHVIEVAPSAPYEPLISPTHDSRI